MSSARREEPFFYGGQAVLEGVMMRGRHGYAVAVRGRDARITVAEHPFAPWVRRARPLRWPLVRGVAAMMEALVIGYRALNESVAHLLAEEEPAARAAAAGALGRAAGQARGRPGGAGVAAAQAASVALAGGLAVVLFVALPAVAVRYLQRYVAAPLALNLMEALIKAAVLVGYVAVIGLWPDMARVYQYHGAEHKAINCLEAGDPLDVEHVRRHSRLHPRCGTSFLLLVVLISAVLFSAVTAFGGHPSLLKRVLVHLALLPLVAALAYEVIRAAARPDGPRAARLLARPGMWLQRLTTREPDGAQMEVAIEALRAVLQQERLRAEDGRVGTGPGGAGVPVP